MNEYYIIKNTRLDLSQPGGPPDTLPVTGVTGGATRLRQSVNRA